MKKVKRKQIDFGGTEEQIVRGDGSLAPYDNRIIVNLKSQYESIEDVINEELQCDIEAKNLLDILDKGGLIEWHFVLNTETPVVYILDQGIIDHFVDNSRYLRRKYYINLFVYDTTINCTLKVKITVYYVKNTRLGTETYSCTCIANYYNGILRTINHESLLPNTLGDINIHDGFYFPNAVQDYDGNWYGAVVVGDQVWLGENLKSIHYSDGEEIPEGHPVNIYGGNVDAARWYPNNDPETVPEYGCFYNWKAATRNENYEDTQTPVIGISPGTAENGDNIWHIPSLDELSTLISYIKNQQRYSDAIGRSVLKFDMDESQITNNKTGLNLPYAGYYYQSSQNFGERATLISSSLIVSGNYRNTAGLNARNADLSTITSLYAMLMGSVRCVSNLTPIQFRNWYIKTYGSMQHILNTEETEEVFICNYNNGSVDKTTTEIRDAYYAGKEVICKINNGGILRLYKLSDTQIQFTGVVSNLSYSLLCTGNTWSYSFYALATRANIPTSAADVHALPDTTKYGATIVLDFDDTYTEVTDTTSKNPVEEGWFERSGTDPNYVYTLTEDTTPVSGKTYYKAGTYIITATLKDQDGNTLGTPQVVDLPLESVVVDGSYNSTTQNVELVLKNGHSIAFSVADLVRGLQTEITLQNPLSADLLTNGTNNKVFSATDKTKLDSIESGAQVNVKSDWNQTNSSSDDYIKNKPTALSSFTNDVGYLTAADISASIVWCNYTETDSTNHTGTMSMTIAEMKTAIASGYIVCLLLGDLVYTLNSKATLAAKFCCVQGVTIHSLTYYDSDSLWHYSFNTLQVNLISGTNIKTINNNSILGSGNLNIREIPASNESNNGKMLKIVNGEWTIVPIAPAYHHAGTKIVAQLIPDLLVAANEGNVYNITDSGTTTDYFIEGSGFPIKAGDNVGIAKVEDGYKFDLLSGFVDTSGFALKSEMSITDGTGANADKTTIQLKSGLTKQVLIQHQDISGKADKSEMVIIPGTGDDADKVNIQLKSGTSVDVLKTHQDISGKADVNGNYPNMTVGLAQNLDDKVTSEEAFLFRPSPNFKGALGKSVRINEIKGRSSKWNQIGNCGNNNTWFTGSNTGSSVTTSGVIANFDAAESTKELSIHNQFPDVHIYYVTFDYSTNKSCTLNVMDTSRTVEATTSYVRYDKYGIRPEQPDNNIDFIVSYDTEDVWSVEIKNLNVIDVTVIFGAGNEPATKADFELWLAANVGLKTYYPYDAGSLLSVKLKEFESIGFNQWDEVWESGVIDTADGSNIPNKDRIRTKNYIPVIPNTSYYKKSNNSFYWVFLYDCDKSYLGYRWWTPNAQISFEKNVSYIRFYSEDGGPSKYNNDICINISQNDNGTYKQHWHRTINLDVTKITGINPNTGIRELVFPNGMRSAGSAYDRIYSDGKVAKATVNIGSVDLGTISWSKNSYSDSIWRFRATLNKKEGLNNIICEAFETNEAPNNYTDSSSYAKDKTICGDSSNNYIKAIYHNANNNYDFTVAMRGILLFYELATPITYTDLQDENGEPIELPLITKASNGGTERILPQNESSMDAIAPILNIEYQVDVEDRIAKLEKIVEGYESGDAFKNARTGFIIDQRGIITDPDTMVSANYYISDRNIDRAFAGILKYEDIVNDDNYVSENATQGSVNNNAISWIRKNAHCFVGKWNGTQMRLRQLSDRDKSKFTDGTDATSYITNAAAADSDTYDVWLKFKKDIYYRCFPIIPTGDTTPNEDLQLVVFCKDKPYNSEQWEKFDKSKLIGIYEGYAANNKAFSISGVQATNNITQTNSKAYARNRGTGFKLVDLQANNVAALLFYGLYSNLKSQAVCGSGTTNYINSTCYPKKTGLCNYLGMTDTDRVNGNGAASPAAANIQAGSGDGIVSITFMSLENWWGDIYEWIDDLQVMQARRPSSVATANPSLYVDDYINAYITNHSGATGAIICIDGVDTLITPTDIADNTVYAEDDKFVSIRDIDGNIVRVINSRLKAQEGNIAKVSLGAHGDVFPKALGGSYNVNSYCDYGGVHSVGAVALRSYTATSSYGGVAYLYLNYGAGSSGSSIGFRLLFEGTPDNTTIVEDGDVW